MFKVNFMSNQMVTAEDINAIGYNLANTVYTTFTDDTTYGVDELNAITQNIVTAGVKRGYENMCAVSFNGSMVFINSGQAFFESGAVMTIDELGISLELEDSTQTNYVYLFFDADTNVAGARCTTTIPGGVDVVLLAEITGTEINPNMDRFCKSRILDAPSTPLVFYNKQAHDGTKAYTENFDIDNLSGYSMIRVTLTDDVGVMMNPEIPDYIRKCTSTIVGDLKNIYAVTLVQNGDSGAYYNGGTWQSNKFKLGFYEFNQNGTRIYLTDNLILKADVENNKIQLICDGSDVPVVVGEQSIKIELFAGEVQ